MCVCVFIKLHLTAQVCPAILVILLCHSYWSSQEGINDTNHENVLSLLLQFLLLNKPWVPCAPPSASLLLFRLSGLAAIILDKPFLFYIFSLSSQVSPVSHRASITLLVCVCVFIELHINAPCVCVFIKLRITAQPGPVLLVILCYYSHCSYQGILNDTYYENL